MTYLHVTLNLNNLIVLLDCPYTQLPEFLIVTVHLTAAARVKLIFPSFLGGNVLQMQLILSFVGENQPFVREKAFLFPREKSCNFCEGAGGGGGDCNRVVLKLTICFDK